MTRNLLLLVTGAAALAFAAGCGPTTHRENLQQWALSASASSTSTTNGTDFTAAQATGAPNVPACGDNPNAWAPATANGGVTDTIDLTYDRYVFVNEVDIFQSYNPGAIVEVDLMAQDGSTAPIVFWQNVAGDPNPNPATTCPAAVDVFTIASNDPGGTPDQYNQIRLYVDENLVGDGNGDGNPANDYVEVDAVQMVGDELVR